MKKFIFIGGIFFVIFSFYSISVYALPEGYQVQAGSAEFNQPDSNTLNISTSDKVIINYQSFSIAQPEAVNFYQPSTSSVALNRVVGQSPSEIFGTLTATGKIFLVNPNGILFGPTSHVDVAGLVASTLDISNNDFLNGNYIFNKYADKIGASVINQGYIQAKSAVLMGSAVKNEGKIVTTLGKTTLASGEKTTLSLDTAGMISVAVDEPVKEEVLQDGAEIKSGVENSGEIEADGGVVVLTAEALDNVFDYAVNNEGVIEANAIDTTTGKVILTANQRVNVAGTINAEGGTVEVDSQGADFRGQINAESGIYNMNDRDTTISGTYSGSQIFSDNGNITVRGDLTVNNGSLTLTADSDGNCCGDFIQDYGVITVSDDIKISGYNITLRAISCGGEINVNASNNITIALPWNYKKEFSINHDLISSDLSNFPVLVKLDSSNFDFSHAKSNGEDIRFVSENGLPLSYEIEKWDSSHQEAYIWVKLPSVSAASDTKFYMYYGNSQAVDAQSPQDVWDSSYSLVLHLNESSGTHSDSTSNQNNATPYGGVDEDADGIIAGCDYFDGSDDYLKVEHASSLNPSSGITVEAWVNIQDLGTWGSIIAKDESDTNRSYALLTDATWNIMKFSVFQSNAEKPSGDWSAPDLNTWIYVVGVYDGSNVQIYGNGELKSESPLSGALDDSTADVMIARNERMSNADNDSYVQGYIDEVRISSIGRDLAWVTASYNTVTSSNFLAVSSSSAVTGMNSSGSIRYYMFLPHPQLIFWLPERFKESELVKQIFRKPPLAVIDASRL